MNMDEDKLPRWARDLLATQRHEIAALKDCSSRTVKRKWDKARAWLRGELSP